VCVSAASSVRASVLRPRCAAGPAGATRLRLPHVA
jgi:hypothetical protein